MPISQGNLEGMPDEWYKCLRVMGKKRKGRQLPPSGPTEAYGEAAFELQTK